MKENKFWLNRAIEVIDQAHPEGEVLLSSGFGPSGMFHVGHLREILTVDALRWGLVQRGRQARHIIFIDDMDAFRKVPANVDAAYEKYLGTPIYKIPAPDGSNRNYAEFFLDSFLEAADAQGVEMKVLWSHKEYAKGLLTDRITETFENLDQVRKIIEEVSRGQLRKDWTPVQIISDNDKMDEWQMTAFDAAKQTVQYVAADGEEGEVSYADGRVKLNWRIDWAARWATLGVNVEPFGRDHASKGGSYDTGKAICEQVFKKPAPVPFPYEFVMLKGQTKKMSASKGDGIIPNDLLDVMPPQVLRYMYLKNRPGLAIYLDTGQNFGRLFDEFAEVEQAVMTGQEHEYKMLYELAMNGQTGPSIVNIPYNHLVASWQASGDDIDKALKILERSEHDASLNREVLEAELKFIDQWLDRWAPEEMKFEIQADLPNVELDAAQVSFTAQLSDAIARAPAEADGEWFHAQIYELKEKNNLEPKAAFQALYRLILGKDSGPKAGWFLSTLDRDWLITRLAREA